MRTIVELISIGDEVLTGHTVDSNAAFIARALLDIGCVLNWRVTVGDDVTDITGAMRAALARADVVITTGGLGPTHDDRTKEALCELFGVTLVHHPEILNELRRRHEARGMVMPRLNENQAMLPAGARLFPNRLGSAVGISMEQEGKALIALPGVPKEMMALMRESVLPHIQECFSPGIVLTRKFRTTGITESKLSELLSPHLELPAGISLAYLPSYGGVDLRLIARQQVNRDRAAELEKIGQTVRRVAGEFIYGEHDDSLEGVIGSMLRERRETIAVAESCTAGMLGAQIANTPGASGYFRGGVIAYDNRVKMTELGVSAEILNQYGAVSAECVAAMAAGAQQKFGTTYALAVSGIAGPDGGTPEKPVGLVWFGLATPYIVQTTSFRLGGDRQIIRQRSCAIALDLLRRSLLNLPIKNQL